jgi:hypothetical protein
MEHFDTSDLVRMKVDNKLSLANETIDSNSNEN